MKSSVVYRIFKLTKSKQNMNIYMQSTNLNFTTLLRKWFICLHSHCTKQDLYWLIILTSITSTATVLVDFKVVQRKWSNELSNVIPFDREAAKKYLCKTIKCLPPTPILDCDRKIIKDALFPMLLLNFKFNWGVNLYVCRCSVSDKEK